MVATVVLSNPDPHPMNAPMPSMVGYAPALNMAALGDVQRALNLLRQAGLLHRESMPKPLLEDGQAGPYTRAAIVAFQQALFLPATGRLDASTRGMLVQALAHIGVAAEAGGAATTGGSPVMNILSVLDVQKALNLLTPNVVNEDGVLGPKTLGALLTFQRTYLLPATGTLDQPTRNTLAQLLTRKGVPAFAPAATAGALPSTPPPVIDRSAQIRQQAVEALQQLHQIGLNAVADVLRRLLGEPTLENLNQAIAFLKLPTTGVFAHQVAALWQPVLDSYLRQPDPNAALRAALPAQMTPLLNQVDTVLGAVRQLANAPTVDTLSVTIAKLVGPEGGALGAQIARPLQAFLTSITTVAAPPGTAHT